MSSSCACSRSTGFARAPCCYRCLRCATGLIRCEDRPFASLSGSLTHVFRVVCHFEWVPLRSSQNNVLARRLAKAKAKVRVGVGVGLGLGLASLGYSRISPVKWSNQQVLPPSAGPRTLTWERGSDVAAVLCEQAGPLAQLLAQNEHVWVHWRLAAADTGGRDGGDAEVAAAAMCLERVAAGTPGARPYDGKNWFPFDAQAIQLLQPSIPDPAAATAAAAAAAAAAWGDAAGGWHLSMQYSFPLGLLRAATHKVPSRP